MGLRFLLLAALLSVGNCFLQRVQSHFTLHQISPRSRISSNTVLRVVTELTTSEEFAKVTSLCESSAIVVIDFQKSQCKPCIRLAPEFEKLAEKFSARGAQFYKIDADSSKSSLALLKENGIRSVPTFQIWSNGKKVDSIQGAHLDEVQEIIENLYLVEDNAKEKLIG